MPTLNLMRISHSHRACGATPGKHHCNLHATWVAGSVPKSHSWRANIAERRRFPAKRFTRFAAPCAAVARDAATAALSRSSRARVCRGCDTHFAGQPCAERDAALPSRTAISSRPAEPNSASVCRARPRHSACARAPTRDARDRSPRMRRALQADRPLEIADQVAVAIDVDDLPSTALGLAAWLRPREPTGSAIASPSVASAVAVRQSRGGRREQIAPVESRRELAHAQARGIDHVHLRTRVEQPAEHAVVGPDQSWPSHTCAAIGRRALPTPGSITAR